MHKQTSGSRSNGKRLCTDWLQGVTVFCLFFTVFFSRVRKTFLFKTFCFGVIIIGCLLCNIECNSSDPDSWRACLWVCVFKGETDDFGRTENKSIIAVCFILPSKSKSVPKVSQCGDVINKGQRSQLTGWETACAACNVTVRSLLEGYIRAQLFCSHVWCTVCRKKTGLKYHW